MKYKELLKGPPYLVYVNELLALGMNPVPKDDLRELDKRLHLIPGSLNRADDTDLCYWMQVSRDFRIYTWFSFSRLRAGEPYQYLIWVLTLQIDGSYFLDLIRYRENFHAYALRPVVAACFRCSNRPVCPECGQPMNIFRKPTGAARWICSSDFHANHQYVEWNAVGLLGEMDAHLNDYVEGLKFRIRHYGENTLEHATAHLNA